MTADDAPTDRDVSPAEIPATVQHEWEAGTTPSTAIIEAVAATTGREPMALPSLYKSVETDAMNTLLARRSDDTTATVHVSFRYPNVDVSTDSGGRLEVRPRIPGCD